MIVFTWKRLEKRFNLSEMPLICLLCRKLTHIDYHTAAAAAAIAIIIVVGIGIAAAVTHLSILL